VTLPDVNVLLYAFRTDASENEKCWRWVRSEMESSAAYGVSPQVLSSVVRIATDRRVFAERYRLDEVLAFCSALLDRPNCVILHPGPRHWSIFCDLCRTAQASGNLIQDAWLAALAIEHGCEWITTDRDYARFPGLRWRTPF
jgi:uncharacterized protein